MLEVMRDILQSRYLHSNVAHKQLARTSLNAVVIFFFRLEILQFASVRFVLNCGEHTIVCIFSGCHPQESRESGDTRIYKINYCMRRFINCTRIFAFTA